MNIVYWAPKPYSNYEGPYTILPFWHPYSNPDSIPLRKPQKEPILILKAPVAPKRSSGGGLFSGSSGSGLSLFQASVRIERCSI